jgi:stage II sporulation protein AA (anti-sigma F factor antagonist)
MNSSTHSHVPSGSSISCVAPADITSTNESAFRAQLDQLIASGPAGWKVLMIDLQGTRMIDSKGLNLLVSVVKRLRAEARDVQLVGPQPAVRRIIAFTRLDRHAAVVNPSGNAG